MKHQHSEFQHHLQSPSLRCSDCVRMLVRHLLSTTQKWVVDNGAPQGATWELRLPITTRGGVSG